MNYKTYIYLNLTFASLFKHSKTIFSGAGMEGKARGDISKAR